MLNVSRRGLPASAAVTAAFAAILVTIGTAGAAVALAQPIHHKAIQKSRQHVTGAASQTAAMGRRSSNADAAMRSPFLLCQHQDPATPALRIGTSECLSLPY
jgi:hypothetical protein